MFSARAVYTLHVLQQAIASISATAPAAGRPDPAEAGLAQKSRRAQ